MNKFEFYSRVKALKVEVNHVTKEFHAFINDTYKAFWRGVDRIAESNLMYLFIHMTEADIPEKVIQDLRKFFNVDKIMSVSKYSPYNSLVWIKRLQREINRRDITVSKYRQRLWFILVEIEDLEEAIESTGKMGGNSITDIKQEIEKAVNLSPSYPENLEKHLILSMDFLKIKKNDFLSLLSIDHSKERAAEMRSTIDNMPDEIDFNRFMLEVFVKNIESPDDDVFFDIFYRGVMDRIISGEIDTSKILHDVIKEPIPVYKAEKDEYGRITSIEKDRPNLTLL
ncbi:hypothetical protein ACIGLI_15745 [Bacillus subtilis]|uniref:hypothetical protein n=1 Tax=Bacillus TaxID=1386 RepID=UPI000D0D1482|nr:hypothetical protein [Bacillus subtilis]MBJ3768142.1 hypothetical protein [Bacillus subtilis]MDI6686122.1 hypothetical protein [Bacillus subtilis]MED4459733.1 hypothetical protein [Bacillus subtilis]PSL97305.1 hypothetical protein C7T97_20575 [Bacillus subtilis]RMD53278.1 hypothetical protein D3Z89_19210 [Bacillus subtilis]